MAGDSKIQNLRIVKSLCRVIELQIGKDRPFLFITSLVHSPGPSSSIMGYSPIAQKSPIDHMGKNVWEKLMVFFPIRLIYLNGTN